MRTLGPTCTKCSTYLLGLAVGLTSIAAVIGITGCHGSAGATVVAAQSGVDPADANLAPVGPNAGPAQAQQPAPAQPAPARALDQHLQNESQQRAEEYPQAGAQAGAPQQPAPNQQSPAYDTGNDDPTYDAQVDAGQAALEADQPPPQLPVYDQPPAPAPNYLWTPGYWGYAPAGYYWVPGAWVAAPYYGALWTPGYWFFYGNRYRFHPGFWGSHIGYYGGINYGFGYTGYGYHGGYWNGNRFYYNQAVNRVNVNNITNVYNRTVVVDNNTRVSYNGGRGGITVRPQPAELAAMHGPRTPPMTAQLQNQREASQNHAQFYAANRGRPAIVASPHPFTADRNVTPQTRPTPVNQPQQHAVQPANPQYSRPAQPQIQANHPQQPNGRPATPQPEVRPAPAQSYTRPEPNSQPPHSELRGPNSTVRPTFNPGITEPTPRPQPEARPTPQPRPTPEIRSAPQPTPRPTYQPSSPPRSTFQSQPQPHPAPQQSRPPAPQHQETHGDGHHPR